MICCPDRSPMDSSESAVAGHEYADALEVERQKLMVFQRDFPLSLQLVTQAICNSRQQQQQILVPPVLEEFIPLKPSFCSSEDEESLRRLRRDDDENRIKIDLDRKPDWLRSVQLWKQEDPPEPMDRPRRPIAVKATCNNLLLQGGAFQPFEKEKEKEKEKENFVPAPAPVVSSTGGCGDEKQEGHSRDNKKKERRAWSPELHRRFLSALDQLGGPHAATPKQIREVMKGDGLTNDEVKSHLQKYRLHSRRPISDVQSSSCSSSQQKPQFLVAGGLWVPPPEYAAVAAAAAVAAQPIERSAAQNKQSSQSPNGPLHSAGRCSQGDSSLADDGATNSTSPTTSSARTITASPPL